MVTTFLAYLVTPNIPGGTRKSGNAARKPELEDLSNAGQ